MAIHSGRIHLDLSKSEGPLAVFLIGARINKLWRVRSWLPVVRAMPRMMRELSEHPELGLLGHQAWFGRTTIMVQYWRSMDHLFGYARGKTHQHLPAWREFNQRARTDAVGVWHEAYEVQPAQVHAVYVDMPAFGLAKVAAALAPSASEQLPELAA